MAVPELRQHLSAPLDATGRNFTASEPVGRCQTRPTGRQAQGGVNERSDPAIEGALLAALLPIVAELVEQELERRLAELAPLDWLTLEQAAERYATTPGAMRKRAERGQLPGAVKDGSRWLVDRRKSDAALAAEATLMPTSKRGERR